MDWLTFFATVIGHLAWPAVVAVLLYLVRRQIGGLAERVEEITLPGGGRAKFLKALEVGREQAEAVAASKSTSVKQIAPPDRSSLELANEFPEAAVLEAYRDVEKYLLEARQKMKLPPRTNTSGILRELLNRNLIDAEAATLFHSLRSARNAAAHGSNSDRITPGEAADYLQQASYLRGYLRTVVAHLPG